MKTQVKCSTSCCYRRKRVTIEEVQFLRQESEGAGQRARLIYPACVKKAFDNPDKCDLDIPLVELLVEAAKKTHRWRISFTPNGM